MERTSEGVTKTFPPEGIIEHDGITYGVWTIDGDVHFYRRHPDGHWITPAYFVVEKPFADAIRNSSS